MFYTVYKTTNLVNGKYYIGMHKTDNIHDDYLGSGKLILEAVSKYGKQNFHKEILFIFDNEQDMMNKEKELVTFDLVYDDNCYNMTVGGTGGPIWLGRNHSEESKELMRQKKLGVKFSEEHKDKLKQKAKAREKSNRLGASHSEESKNKIREARSKQVNVKGGLLGKIWINDGSMEKGHLSGEDIPPGWTRGRLK